MRSPVRFEWLAKQPCRACVASGGGWLWFHVWRVGVVIGRDA